MIVGLAAQGLCMSCRGDVAAGEQTSYVSASSARGNESIASAPPVASTPVAQADPSEREVDEAIARSPQDPTRAGALMIAAERARRRYSASDASSTANTSRSHTVRALRALSADHPRYARADEALFRLGSAMESEEEQGDARRAYLLLIQRFPTSRFVGFAYLAFAELFRRQADHDSSRQFYEQIVRMNASPELVAYATYQIGRAHVAQSRCATGVQSLVSAQRVSGAPQEITDAAAADIASLGTCSPGATLAAQEVSAPQPPLTSESALASDSAPSGPK